MKTINFEYTEKLFFLIISSIEENTQLGEGLNIRDMKISVDSKDFYSLNQLKRIKEKSFISGFVYDILYFYSQDETLDFLSIPIIFKGSKNSYILNFYIEFDDSKKMEEYFYYRSIVCDMFNSFPSIATGKMNFSLHTKNKTSNKIIKNP